MIHVLDTYPNRTEACRIYRSAGENEAARQEVERMSLREVRDMLREHGQDKDPSILWWLHHIETRVMLRHR